MNVIVYHDSCPDGFGAAWAARKFFTERDASGADGDRPNQVRFIPALYGTPLPGVEEDDDVILVDFSWPAAQLAELLTRCETITVIDHHKSAIDDLRAAASANHYGVGTCDLMVYLDETQSGAVLAWRYFFGDREIPALLRYVQDRDLWRFELPHSREINAWISSYPREFVEWDDLDMTLTSGNPAYPIQEGAAILRAQAQLVERMAAEAVWGEIGGHRVMIANAPVLYSEVGEYLCQQHPEMPFAAYYRDMDNRREWGLRSNKGFDVSDIAKAYGGGGHSAAAGFRDDPVRTEPRRPWRR